MNDMTAVISPKSDQINADDLIAGPMTITIRDVRIAGGQEQPVSIYFEGSDKAFRPCKSMSRVLVQGWGPDARKYVGRSLTVYRDPTVKWAGLEVGGIRISHMSDIDGEKLMMLTATKGQRKPHKVYPLVVEREDAAAKWAASFIANVEQQTVEDALQALIQRAKKNLAGLEANRPELHKQCEDAITSKAASFDQQGPDDSQCGESFTADKAALRKAIDAATDARSLEDAQADVVAADLTDEERVELEHAVGVRRDALKVAA